MFNGTVYLDNHYPSQVQLTNELSTATAELADAKLELNSSKKTEAELCTQLDAAVTLSKKQQADLTELQAKVKGLCLLL